MRGATVRRRNPEKTRCSLRRLPLRQERVYPGRMGQINGVEFQIPEDEPDRERRRQEAWAELRLPAPRFEDERNSPAIDKDELRETLRGFANLPRTQQIRTAELSVRFRSWAYTIADIVAEEYREGRALQGLDTLLCLRLELVKKMKS